MRRLAHRLALAALLFASPRPSLAIEEQPVVRVKNVIGSEPNTRFRLGAERWFVSGRVDAGFFFFRPRFSAGYGLPHVHWLGADFVPVVSPSALGAYGGVRIERPWFELRTGALYQYSFNRSFLEAQPSFEKRDIDLVSDDRASYTIWDSELELDVPLGHFALLYELQPIYTGQLPQDRYVYVDSLFVVAASGWTIRQELGFEWFLPRTHLGVAPTVEMLWLDRREAVVFRAGFSLRLVLSDEVQVRTRMLPVVSSPDALGRTGGEVLELSVRWLWATE